MGSSFKIDHIFKVLIIGDSAVGKSSMMLRFTEDSFDEHLQSTIGVDFKVKIVNIREKTIKLTLWDTAGQERFRTLTSSYYRGAQGVLLVYDVTRLDTFENLSKWLEEVNTYHTGHSSDLVKLLVGNKIDCERVVPREMAEDWARTHGMIFVETSAKTEEGIEFAFNEVAHKMLDNPALLETSEPRRRRSTLDSKFKDESKAQKGMCC